MPELKQYVGLDVSLKEMSIAVSLARQRAFDARGHRRGIEEACASR
jgi:hypothetical protein